MEEGSDWEVGGKAETGEQGGRGKDWRGGGRGQRLGGARGLQGEEVGRAKGKRAIPSSPQAITFPAVAVCV